MARWEEAYDALLDLYQFMGTPRGAQYVSGWTKSAAADSPNNALPGAVYDRLSERVTAYAFNAEPVWVDPDMMTLWESALADFQEEPMHDTDLPTECGFVWLPRPLMWRDVHDKVISFRAFMWAKAPMTVQAPSPTPRPLIGERDVTVKAAPARRQVTLKPKSSKTDADGNVTLTTEGVVLLSFHRVGDPDDYVTPEEYKAAGYQDNDLMVDGIFPWVFSDRSTPGDKRNISRPLQCLWRLMSQTIAAATKEVPAKPFRKRWKKAGLDEKRVVVVRLRRPDHSGSGEKRDVAWSQRWIVSGHWRNQWYPSLSLHRQVWIGAYTKGPEDMPLVIRKTRVWELVQ